METSRGLICVTGVGREGRREGVKGMEHAGWEGGDLECALRGSE